MNPHMHSNDSFHGDDVMHGLILGWRALKSSALALIIILSAVGVATAGPGQGRRARLDKAIRQAVEAAEPVAAIVSVDPNAADAIRERLAKRGRKNARRFSSVSALATELLADDIEAMEGWDGVLGISLDAPLAATAASSTKGWTPWKPSTASTTTTTTSKTTTPTFGSEALKALIAEFGASQNQWLVVRGALGLTSSSVTGSGVGVAVVDSGIDGSLAAFSGRISGFYDFTKGGKAATPTDEYGHGTHVAALIGSAGLTFSGVAPRVRFVGVKVLDAAGAGRTSDLIAALDFLVAKRKQLDIQVINLSLGHPIFEPAATDPLVQAVERAVRAGLVVVTSAGNYGQNPTTGLSGYAGITSPGNAPSAITVGSLDLKGTADRRDDVVSPFSSRGPTWYDGYVKPDVLAPGHGLFAASATDSTLSTKATLSPTGGEVRLYGTSMAAATTTGVVALMLEANRLAFPAAGRDLPPAALKAMLQYTSVAVNDPATGGEYDLLSQGAGGLNAAGALALARNLDTSKGVGKWWLSSGVDEQSALGGATLPWTRRILWGTSALYGQAVYANAAAWQNNIVWGDALVWGESLKGAALIWGDTIVWSENIVLSNALIWGEALVWGESLVSFEGQTIVWSDALIWGEALIWGDTLIWGESTVTPQP